MSWKIISMALPEEDHDILRHLASVPHSWTVDHDHSTCRTQLPVCHASSHEYGPSGNIDGSHQHQHFIMQSSDDITQEQIEKAHRVYTHANGYCTPATCEAIRVSHATNHKLCYGSWCEPTRELVLGNLHKSRMHAQFCTPEICPIMAAHEQGNHEGCFHK